MIPKLAFEDSSTARIVCTALNIAATEMYGKASRYVDEPSRYDYYMLEGDKFSLLAEEANELGDQLAETERAIDELASVIQTNLDELAMRIPMCSDPDCLIHSKRLTRDDVIGIIALSDYPTSN